VVPPPNDSFAKAEVLAGTEVTYQQSTLGATVQPNETSPHPDGTPATVWFSWTAPYTGTVTMDVCGSQQGLDTVLAVFQGPSLGTLATIAWDDDACDGTQALLSYLAVSGMEYRISVGDHGGTGGDVALHVAMGEPSGLLSVQQQIDFGEVPIGLTSRRVVTLMNTGDAPITIDDVRLEVYPFAEGEYAVVSKDVAGSTIEPHTWAEVMIRFRPTERADGPLTWESRSAYKLDSFRLPREVVDHNGAIPVASQVFYYLRNTGGRGTDYWDVYNFNTITGMVEAQLNGQYGNTDFRAGELYAVSVRSPFCGPAEKVIQDLYIGSALVTSRTIEPASTGGSVPCLQDPAVTFTRMGDAVLVVETSAPVATAVQPPYLLKGQSTGVAATVVLGEGAPPSR